MIILFLCKIDLIHNTWMDINNAKLTSRYPLNESVKKLLSIHSKILLKQYTITWYSCPFCIVEQQVQASLH